MPPTNKHWSTSTQVPVSSPPHQPLFSQPIITSFCISHRASPPDGPIKTPWQPRKLFIRLARALLDCSLFYCSMSLTFIPAPGEGGKVYSQWCHARLFLSSSDFQSSIGGGKQAFRLISSCSLICYHIFSHSSSTFSLRPNSIKHLVYELRKCKSSHISARGAHKSAYITLQPRFVLLVRSKIILFYAAHWHDTRWPQHSYSSSQSHQISSPITPHTFLTIASLCPFFELSTTIKQWRYFFCNLCINIILHFIV